MKSSILVFAVFCSVMPSSQAADIADQQLIHQQARQQALEVQLAPPPADVRLSVPDIHIPMWKHFAGGGLGFNVSWQC